MKVGEYYTGGERYPGYPDLYDVLQFIEVTEETDILYSQTTLRLIKDPLGIWTVPEGYLVTDNTTFFEDFIHLPGYGTKLWEVMNES